MDNKSKSCTSLITSNMHPSWKTCLSKEFECQYFIDLKLFLIDEYKKNAVYPKMSDLFKSFEKTPFDKVKVIILGQDPYHGINQAQGLSFSVPRGVKIPPSLKNIFKELKNDLNIKNPMHGDLSSWAEQGVLLLNSTLSVREGQALSHRNKGWEKFTDAAITALSQKRSNLIFLLWGKQAISKKGLIDQEKHRILESTHPSPLSAYRGFLGCKHFSLANNYLISQNLSPIDWEIN